MPRHVQSSRNSSFSDDDITKAFQASAAKPRNHLSLKIVQQEETIAPPTSPLDQRSSMFGSRADSKRTAS
jgi:hypothetical protein